MKIILMILGIVQCVFAEGTSETIFSISDDGNSATKYYSSRGDIVGDRSFMFESGYDTNNVSYARPGNYTWKESFFEKYTKTYRTSLMFPQTSSYGYLETINDKEEFIVPVEGFANRYFISVFGSGFMDLKALMDENIISTKIPSKYTVIGLYYTDNRRESWSENGVGNWKIVGNTYTFYAKNVNSLEVGFIVEESQSYGQTILSNHFDLYKFIQVSGINKGIKVIIPLDKLFPSGSNTLTKEGKLWLSSITKSLGEFNYKELRVEGHTDNIPVKKKKHSYKNNWELSTSRAQYVVEMLIQQGLDPMKLAVVGYGSNHPISDNLTKQGRAKNRRIEFTIITDE